MGEHIKNKDEKDAFFVEMYNDDILEQSYGYDQLGVGALVTAHKEGFDLDQIYIITKKFDDGTFEIGTENSVFPGMRFTSKELSRISVEEETFPDIKGST